MVLSKKMLLNKLVLYFILSILAVIVLLPLIYIISISFSSDGDILKYGYTIIPHHFYITAYTYLFKDPGQLINAYIISITVMILGTTLGLLLSSSLAYVMIRKDYRYSRHTNFYVFFTLLFNGGLVPFYMVMTNILHVQDTLFALFIPYSVNAWFTFLMKGFMQGMPFEIIESSKIDGSSELNTFLKIVLPLSKPALATVGLFYAFAYWNDWWLAMLFINNEKLVPLQYFLYRTMDNITYLLQHVSTVENVDLSKIPGESIRMAIALLAAGPMVIVFPFIQKFFVKGLMVGSVKG